MTEIFDDHGVRFEYPSDWEIEVTDDGEITTVALQSPGRPAFALVTLDEAMPEPDEVAGEVLDTMREEYPGLDVFPVRERIAGHEAVGHDLDFISLDMTSACLIRCFRTNQRTILIFGQWSEFEDEPTRAAMGALQASFEETDA